MNNLSFAVVGIGHIGKRHAKMIQENPQTTLCALIDTNTHLKKELEKEFNVPFFATLEDFLTSDIMVDVINICSPNHLHCAQALQALEKAHVVIEKPMGLTIEECEKVITKGKEKNKEVFCVMQNRYSPPSLLLKSLVSNHQLGEVHHVQVNCFWNRDDRYYSPNGKKHTWKGVLEKDGGVLFTQFSHFIDTLHWLFGPLKITGKQSKNFQHKNLNLLADTGFFSFELNNGGMGTFHYSTAVWDVNMESSISIIGEKGSIKVAGQYMNEIVHCHIKDFELPEMPPINPPNDYGTYKGSAANHQYVIDNVVDVILNNGKMTTPAEDGLNVVKLITSL